MLVSYTERQMLEVIGSRITYWNVLKYLNP